MSHSHRHGMRSDARCASAAISSAEGTRGEWMSHTPGPISFGYSNAAKASSSSMSLRAVSMQATRRWR